MAPSFDCTGSSLLCAEDNNSLMCFDEEDDGFGYDGGFGVYEEGYDHQKRRFLHGGGCVDFYVGFGLQSEECLDLLVEREWQHLPCEDYLERLKRGDLDVGMRREAVDWMEKVHNYYCFGPLSAYLSVSYLDRFLSAYELPRGKNWMMQLLAVACLSLAAKMEETDVPLCLDLQVAESKFIFEARTIKRMELLVLSTLKWRMQGVTPFSFIDSFLWKINGDQLPPMSMISKSIELTLSIIKSVDYLKFRPSEVAAAVAVSVVGESQILDFDITITHFIKRVEKERVMKCVEMIQEMSFIDGSNGGARMISNGGSVPFVPQSPIGVLDAACFSYKSDELTVGSCANSSHSSPEVKRRKLNHQQPSEVDLVK
ncbi:hypothetical protein Syun_015458 [Stephania yunnanensis]|uniref:Cyclin N-terminal domain-containing protein n=1 Tax=Stephania yunnanensis TaxID=152371 RepID=A0AAP0JMX6_9MAGN